VARRRDQPRPGKKGRREGLAGGLRRGPGWGREGGTAPGRARRPGAWRPQVEPPTQEELGSGPFCAGHEDMTPPQTLVLPEEGDWKVRVVPNLYPALERQEVVVHSHRHIRSIAEAADDELDLVAEAWRRRAGGERGHVVGLINE